MSHKNNPETSVLTDYLLYLIIKVIKNLRVDTKEILLVTSSEGLIELSKNKPQINAGPYINFSKGFTLFLLA